MPLPPGTRWILPIDPPGEPRVFLKTPYFEGLPVFSPDGRWIAYNSNESGSYQLYVRPFPGPGGKWQVSSDGSLDEHYWSADGTKLHYRSGDGRRMMMTPLAATGDTLTVGKPVALFTLDADQYPDLS